MSISDEIEAAKAAGLLVPFAPPLHWPSAPRVFLMSHQLAAEIKAGRASRDELTMARWAALDADISYFVEGGYVNSGLLKWLDPEKFEHWTLRSVRPKPSLRVFGRFALPDVFVGTHAVARVNLRAKWSVEWEMEKLKCEDIWRGVFTSSPFSANTYEEHVTENAERHPRIER